MNEELFGELHEQEEYGLFGKEHERQQCFLHSVTESVCYNCFTFHENIDYEGYCCQSCLDGIQQNNCV